MLLGKKNHNKKTVHKMHFKKMRKSLSEIRSLRKKDDKAAADKTDAAKKDDKADGEKKTEVLGKAVLDPENNPCKLQEGFESFTPYKNLWVNITRYYSTN